MPGCKIEKNGLISELFDKLLIDSLFLDPHFKKTHIYEPIKIYKNNFSLVGYVENNHRHSLTSRRDSVSVQEEEVPPCCLYILWYLINTPQTGF